MMQLPLWQLLAVGLAMALVLWRIVGALRRAGKSRQEDWDEKLVRNLRAQSPDPFAPRDFDFFFSLESAARCQQFAAVLQPLGFSVDYKEGGEVSIGGFTLHARKALPVSITSIQDTVREMRALAAAHQASYDGWAAAGMLGQKAART